MNPKLKWPEDSQLLQTWLIKKGYINELEDLAKQYIITKANDKTGLFRICYDMQSKITDEQYGIWIDRAVWFKNYYDTFRIRGSAILLKKLIRMK